MKKRLIMSLTLILAIGLVTGCGCGKKKETSKSNGNSTNQTDKSKEKGINKEVEVDGLKLKNVSFSTSNDSSSLATKIVNSTNKDYHLEEFYVIFKDANGKEINKITIYVGDTIKVGEKRIINSSIEEDLSKAKKIEYEISK